MAEKSGQLGPKDHALAAALALGANQTEAALAAGVSVRTVARRLAVPEFRELINQCRADAVDAASGKLAGLAELASAGLRRVLETGGHHATVAAARVVFDQLLRLRDSVEFERRLQQLERKTSHADNQSDPTDF